ncbi:hypothetical protein CASFOL_028397 [Castilleja foliolosa]|uniref:Uncharacterized protein n=1 Tax=Castilleja foliolosa TaxID=1961234 RepID=A0ABD3CCF9_9LAMI
MQTYETDQDDIDETVSSAVKRKRGPTMGRGLMKAGTCGKKIKIEVNPAIGRSKERVESAKFSSQVGVVARDVLPVVRKWKEIDVQNALDPCIDYMQIHLDVNMDQPGVRQCVIDRLKNSSRQQRYRLHVHYKKFGNVREAKRNKPASVNDQQQWEILCDHFNSPEFQHQSEANSNNRKKMQAKHVTGRTPFTIIQNEISLKNGECDMIELYKFTHENVRGKWSSDVAKKNWEYAAEGVEKSEQEIVTEVIGRANGYIKGLGYGPKPPGKQSQLQQELEETRAELGVSKTEAATYKSTVNAMNEQLKQHKSPSLWRTWKAVVLRTRIRSNRPTGMRPTRMINRKAMGRAMNRRRMSRAMNRRTMSKTRTKTMIFQPVTTPTTRLRNWLSSYFR